MGENYDVVVVVVVGVRTTQAEDADDEHVCSNNTVTSLMFLCRTISSYFLIFVKMKKTAGSQIGKIQLLTDCNQLPFLR